MASAFFSALGFTNSETTDAQNTDAKDTKASEKSKKSTEKGSKSKSKKSTKKDSSSSSSSTSSSSTKGDKSKKTKDESIAKASTKGAPEASKKTSKISKSGSGSSESSSSGSGGTSSNQKTSSGAKVTGSNFKSKYENPCDRARVIRLPGGPRGGCCPPPWGMPPCPPPWGCPPPYPPPPFYPPPWGCPPGPPMPPCRPPGFPPFAPVCDFSPGGKQIYRVPRGCSPPCSPIPGGGICGQGGAQPCYNNCNFYTSSDPFSASRPYPSCSGPSPCFPPQFQSMIPSGGGMGDGGRPFEFGNIPSRGGDSLGMGSSEDFFKDLDELASMSNCKMQANNRGSMPPAHVSSGNKNSGSGKSIKTTNNKAKTGSLTTGSPHNSETTAEATVTSTKQS